MGRQRDIDAIVDDNPGTGAASGFERAPCEVHQRTIVEAAFADLNQIDAGMCGLDDDVEQRPLASATGGHKTDDGR